MFYYVLINVSDCQVMRIYHKYLLQDNPQISKPILQAFTEAGNVVFWSAAGVITVAFVLSFFVKEIPLRKTSGVAAKAEEEAKMAAMH